MKLSNKVLKRFMDGELAILINNKQQWVNLMRYLSEETSLQWFSGQSLLELNYCSNCVIVRFGELWFTEAIDLQYFERFSHSTEFSSKDKIIVSLELINETDEVTFEHESIKYELPESPRY